LFSSSTLPLLSTFNLLSKPNLVGSTYKIPSLDLFGKGVVLSIIGVIKSADVPKPTIFNQL